jgi:prepilin-type processing-associated H-X9-DG protein
LAAQSRREETVMMRKTDGTRSGGAKVKIAAFVVLVMAILALMLVCEVRRAERGALLIRCRGNLARLAKGMMTYSLDIGNKQWYPCPLGRGRDPSDYNGAEWLAMLYWTGVVPEPRVFLCPSSGDTNAEGAHLGDTGTSADFGSQTVSYAGMHWRSLTATGCAIRDDRPPKEALASDGTQGTVNHSKGSTGGLNVLFADAHVEWKPAEELDPETAVGKKGGLLEKLRN